MQNNSELASLSLADLELSDLDVQGLATEDALGVPELGASCGTYGCCTHCSVAEAVCPVDPL
jgi:hypothetical protein